MTNLNRYLLTIIVFICISLILPTATHAVGYGVSLNPPLLRVNIKPGKTITQVFTITNLNNEEKLLVARIVPFTQSDDRGNPSIDMKSSPSWLNYFSLANTNIRLGSPFTVKAKSSEQLILTLSIPANAILRDLYSTLLITTYSNVAGIVYQGSQVSATIGANLLVTIHSDINPPTILKITSVLPQTGAFFKIGNFYFADNITPLTFSASVKNEGSFTSETKGIFKVTGHDDTPIYLEGVLPVYVISNTQRVLLNTKGENFYFSPNLTQIGFFKAVVQINSENSHTGNSVDIFFFPFKIIAGVIFATMFLAIILRTTRTIEEIDRPIKKWNI
ncbi:hypothetical protein A3K29_05620 [Candidatus Collierbacteria bacterium RIFOXYB2_FULL_46_14]|uniref:DUF916 domain-containing protein n=1 Tax=Candidatus Collierbacteria bacterium GW2011_GWA2_46_26 TaxID=1618381 RepID=A0A0G1PIJ1_9BACT|nr:MAG: hypothetical protein UX47_C0009G0036 [Candidatus Collierbacteria bacterium GW2011_GWA2_46_26]OGD73567.1 MAG: hypothetical protein A3K29_05620 [Candidatus Collierbacteria bacterium RIFOXYB2_FULL_46_14]OGD76609.1 MAG: hypothetical protein A3K43_05620 [Candidatus Collierbacteria bacterium RIFOXYA2_FULL_46_20]OGD77945.1 MAG: hypothetical protein A3K39_05620 [Candidatus Collierbacteria bacterium RIFOXYC2_FULL_43_15]OGD79969.1 MAG: hypothetical protein A2320_00050 [Pseudomonadales bacterium G